MLAPANSATTVRPVAQAKPVVMENDCVIVPSNATPTEPPTWRAELRRLEARPECLGSDDVKTPAVIAGMIEPIAAPNIPSPAPMSQSVGKKAVATSVAEPIAAMANPMEIRRRKYWGPFLLLSSRLTIVGNNVNGVSTAPAAKGPKDKAFCR